MKKLILAAFALITAASVFAQGTITFNNRLGTTLGLVTHVYAPLAANPSLIQSGNGPGDTPAGATDWAGWSLIGTPATGQYSAAATFAQLLFALPATPTAFVAASSPPTIFRTGAGAGFTVGVTATAANVGLDAPAVVQMVAWDNSSGNYGTWALAEIAWQGGLIAAGKSVAWNTVLGGTGTPPNMDGVRSFNLYMVPEPSTFALAGLGAAALMIFRRRK